MSVKCTLNDHQLLGTVGKKSYSACLPGKNIEKTLQGLLHNGQPSKEQKCKKANRTYNKS